MDGRRVVVMVYAFTVLELRSREIEYEIRSNGHRNGHLMTPSSPFFHPLSLCFIAEIRGLLSYTTNSSPCLSPHWRVCALSLLFAFVPT